MTGGCGSFCIDHVLNGLDYKMSKSGNNISVCVRICIVFFLSNAVADVVPDGSTATSVAVATGGHETVSIAPANADRISFNTYTRFDVNRAGASLDNTSAIARTIVNEVTGAGASQLQGMLDVLGSPAHVIIANPNGIHVDGARFVNVGALALATGSVDIRPGSTHAFQDNVYVTTTGGRITIGDGGLSGTMNSLDLLAKEIAINGSIELENDLPSTKLDIYAGSHESEFNSALFTSDAQSEWNQVTALNGAAATEVIVDITRSASLNASRIQVVVTDQGAGVRLQGDVLASRGNFELSSSGLVLIDGGHVSAAANVIIDAESVKLENNNPANDADPASIKAIGGGVLVRANSNIENIGGRIQGNTRIATEVESGGAVTLIAGSDIVNQTVDDERLSIIFGENDNIVLAAQQNIINQAGRVISNRNVLIDAGESFGNVITEPDFNGRGELLQSEKKEKRSWYSGFLKRKKSRLQTIDYGELALAGELAYIIADGDITINAANVTNAGGEINANNGDIDITTSTLNNEAILSGRAELITECEFGCDRSGFSTVETHGGQIQSSGSITINAAVNVNNIGGRFLAIQDLNINADEIRTTAVDVYDVVERPKGMRGFFSYHDALLLRKDQGGSFISNMGRINLNAVLPVIVEGGVIEAAEGVTAPNGIDIVRERQEDSSRFREHIGLLK